MPMTCNDLFFISIFQTAYSMCDCVSFLKFLYWVMTFMYKHYSSSIFGCQSVVNFYFVVPCISSEWFVQASSSGVPFNQVSVMTAMFILWSFSSWLIIKSLFFANLAFKVAGLMLLSTSKPFDSAILICLKLFWFTPLAVKLSLCDVDIFLLFILIFLICAIAPGFRHPLTWLGLFTICLNFNCE